MDNVRKQKNKGFALLFAVLVSILVLSVGASLITLSLKQYKLSNSARDSQFAFYASNTGIECAMYWDYHPDDDGTVVFKYQGGPDLYTTIDNVKCVGDTLIEGVGWELASFDGTSTTTKFRISFAEAGNNIEYCADVTVIKTIDGDSIDTTIYSNGYNTCDPSNDRRIERGLRVSY